MATATIAKPGQALKRQRPSISMQTRTRTGTADESDEPVAKLSEPYVKTPEYILRKFKGQPPSLVVHLHQNFFRFDKQEGSFSYQSEMKLFMQHLQHQTVPHELMGELMTEDVKFYDGHLIVEVHNHRAAESKTQKGTDTSAKNSNTVAFSMHNSGDHVTPSPYGPYPRKSHEQSADGTKTSASPAPQEKDKGASTEKTPSISANKKAAGKADVYTLVLFPTEQSREADMMLLTTAPVLDGHDGRKGSTAKDGSDRTSSVPQTPTSKKSAATAQKMRLEAKDFYDFQADYLLHTEGPLLLEPAKTPQEAQRALDLLAHPLHSQPPPASRGRKRTQAELAAEDALAAREEHRMLIMDERIKPTNRGGNAASEAQSGSAQLGFSRFKTLETIKQKHEEKEQKRKEEEARAAMEKRQHDMAMAQKRKLMEEQQRQRQTQDAQAKQMLMRQQAIQQQQQQQQAQAQAQAQVQAQAHAHPAAAMAQNPQQQQLQQQAAMNHSSPIIRNQTPMHNSSPMMQNANVMQAGFPMQPSMSSQGAGSPQRPGSAMHHPGVAMARQISQQQNQSRHNTPQISGTPQLMPSAPADINRQMSATPQMQHGSPVQGMTGTPNQNMMMQTPQMNQQGMTQQQQQQQQQHQTMMTMMANRQRAQMMQAQMQGQNMNPMQMQQMRQLQQQQQQQQGQGQMNPAMYQAQMQRMQLQMAQNQQQQQQLLQRMGGEQMQQTPSQQSQLGQGQGGMNNADPTVVAQQRQLMIQRNKMNQQMRQMAANGQLNPNMQQHLMAQQQRNLQQQQQLAMNVTRNLGDRNNPEQYMQNLRVQQAMMARVQQQQAQMGQMAGQMQAANNNNGGGGGGGNMMMNNNMNMQQQQQQQMRQQQQQNANADLAQQFAAMQNALQGNQQQRPGTGMG